MSKHFRELIQNIKHTHAYVKALAIINFQEDLLSFMEAEEITEEGLSSLTGVDLKKMFSDEEELTFDVMIKITKALGCKLEFNLVKREKNEPFN